MAALPVSYTEVSLDNLHALKKIKKTEGAKLYETQVYTKADSHCQSLLFWTPSVQFSVKEHGRISLLLPQTDECEQLFDLFCDIDRLIVDISIERWKRWFQEDVTLDDVTDRYKTSLKAGSKREEGRIINMKLGNNFKHKLGDTIADNTQLTDGRGLVLVELKRLVFGKSNFKCDYVIHQIQEERIEVEPSEMGDDEPLYFESEEWVSP